MSSLGVNADLYSLKMCKGTTLVVDNVEPWRETDRFTVQILPICLQRDKILERLLGIIALVFGRNKTKYGL
jgi:hypothetical protein